MDPETPLEETMEALAQIVRSGKALYVGISNYDGETMKRAADILEELHCPFIINQNRYNIFNRTIETNGLKQAAAEKKKGDYRIQPVISGNAHRPIPEWNPKRQPCQHRRAFSPCRSVYGRTS